ncbi:GntR family transcriptional regulator [Microbacteriaceae bacterium VKM Ac-2855]|nr:GntR family transcriptional regulator [Microbacteriaceae bacterium VKM Ac-2855]
MPSEFVIEHDSPLTAWGQVHRDLRRRVEAGEFAVGERIPSESELIAFYEVSRPTVRRATRELVSDGYLVIRQGAGTFVRDRPDVRCDIDIRRPWRKQIISTGHRAISELLETRPNASVPREITSLFDGARSDEPSTYGRHMQVVDGIPIAITESWYSIDTGLPAAASGSITIEESGLVEVGMTTSREAQTLRSFLDIPLIVVTTVSRAALTGRLVEISRTSWLASRVRLIHTRIISLADLDMTGLLQTSPATEQRRIDDPTLTGHGSPDPDRNT